jgi:hypothetical protein
MASRDLVWGLRLRVHSAARVGGAKGGFVREGGAHRGARPSLPRGRGAARGDVVGVAVGSGVLVIARTINLPGGLAAFDVDVPLLAPEERDLRDEVRGVRKKPLERCWV